MPTHTTTNTVYLCPRHMTVIKLPVNEQCPAGYIAMTEIHLIFSSCGRCISTYGYRYESEERVRAGELPVIRDTVITGEFHRGLVELASKNPYCTLTYSHEVYSISGVTRLPYDIATS